MSDTVPLDTAPVDTVLLDVDGTLIDSNYWHVAAWQRAFAGQGVWQPAWRLHSFIGMGGDRLVAAVAGDDVEKRCGDDLRKAWKTAYDELIGNVQVFPQAADLLRELKRRGLKVVLASSGKPDHLDYARRLLDADDVIDDATTGDDVESSKPAADLFELALCRVDGVSAVVIGDAPWDVRAADGMTVLGLRCGGFSQQILLDAGATAVLDDPADLLARLGETPLG